MNAVVIKVIDSGMGVPEDAREKLFTPLFNKKSKGQGFGLAVVNRLTEALGRTVTFKSEKGVGDSVYCSLTSAEEDNLPNMLSKSFSINNDAVVYFSGL